MRARPGSRVAILAGVAAGWSHGEIGKCLGISKDLVKWRMREIRRIYRERMAELGMVGRMQPLRLFF